MPYPTLLIGLGGWGSQIVDQIYTAQPQVVAYCIDTDESDLKSLQAIPKSRTISLSLPTVAEGLTQVPGAQDWFPNHKPLLHRCVYMGAGQVRAVGRLCYEAGILNGRFDGLLSQVRAMAEEATDAHTRLQVKIVTSLAGGTGAGCFLQLALLVRKYEAEHYPRCAFTVHGEFILPSVFDSVAMPAARDAMYSNCYAALKELVAIHTIGLQLPYDRSEKASGLVKGITYDSCCFLGKSAAPDILSVQKAWGSTIAARLDRIPADAVMLHDPAVLAADPLFACETGLYYRAYQACCHVPGTITPHLDSSWATQLPDIGCQ